MIPLTESLFSSKRKVYRVRSLHQTMGGKTFIRTRHFFTKANARYSYERLLKSQQSSVPHSWGKVLAAEFRESHPLVFPEDEIQAAHEPPA